ncbi:MAG: hypothetical protein WCP57_01340 [Bacteroidota bacterium]
MKKYMLRFAMIMIGIIALSSCENKVEEKLEGDWKLVSMETTGFIISGQQLNSPVLSLEKDKTYSIFIDGKLTKGKWKVKDNAFYLLANDNKEESALILDSLTDNTLIYHNKSGKSDVKVYYTKVENEEEGEEKK